MTEWKLILINGHLSSHCNIKKDDWELVFFLLLIHPIFIPSPPHPHPPLNVFPFPLIPLILSSMCRCNFAVLSFGK